MNDWKARAEREAAALLAGYGGMVTDFDTRDKLINLLALAWLQGNIAGTHETLAAHELAFDQLRAAL